MLERLKIFFRETRTEWRHINWPSRKEAFYLTSVVIALSLVLALFLGAFDYLFLTILKTILAFR